MFPFMQAIPALGLIAVHTPEHGVVIDRHGTVATFTAGRLDPPTPDPDPVNRRSPR